MTESFEPNPDTINANSQGPTRRLRASGSHYEARSMMALARDVLSPREVADRAGFSYHAILRAIRRGDLNAFEPIPGHYRIELAEYDRWLRRPARRGVAPPQPTPRCERIRVNNDPAYPGSFARLKAIERSL